MVPSEVRLCDEYHELPGESSLRFEADLAPFKPRADVYFSNAISTPPGGNPASTWTASFTFGGLTKEIRVFGNRKWVKRKFLGWSLQCEPATECEVIYENAFGGSGRTKSSCFEENPIGLGFKIDDFDREADYVAAHSIEHINEPNSTRYGTRRVAGLGPISRFWQPRLSHAGTYDQQWKETRWPFWPDDLDTQFFNCAPRDQQLQRYATGNEKVELINLTPSGHCSFELPFGQQIGVGAIDDSGKMSRGKAELDTIVIDAVDLQIQLTWRIGLAVEDPRTILVDYI